MLTCWPLASLYSVFILCLCDSDPSPASNYNWSDQTVGAGAWSPAVHRGWAFLSFSVCRLGGIMFHSLMFINDRPNFHVLYMYFVVFYWHLSLLSEFFACCLHEFSVMCHCHCPFSISTTTGSCHAHHSAENSSDTCYFQPLNNCCQFYTFYHMYLWSCFTFKAYRWLKGQSSYNLWKSTCLAQIID